MINGRLIILKPDGSKIESYMLTPPTLEMLQGFVGGYVERVPYFDKYEEEECVAYCDEEGKMKNYAFNGAATAAWFNNNEGVTIRDFLVGDIVILQGQAMRGWT